MKMKIELYLVPKDIHGKAIKLFLDKNKLFYKSIITDDISILRRVSQDKFLQKKISILKTTFSSSVQVQIGFNENYLNQLLEHIKRYKAKIKKW